MFSVVRCCTVRFCGTIRFLRVVWYVLYGIVYPGIEERCRCSCMVRFGIK